MKINSIDDLNEYLGINAIKLKKLMYCASKGYLYVDFEIKKKNGKFRKINAPIKELKEIQYKIYNYLKTIYCAKKSSYGFEIGKNNILNAEKHKKHKYVLNIDLKDMFSQITANRIKGMLKSEPYNLDESVARTISIITCYKGFLPQGAPTSPILSNMLLKMLDTKLIKYSKNYNLYYTRYADDLTFSSNRDFSKIAFNNYPNSFDVSEELKSIFNKSNFIINCEKTRYYTYYRRQEVTGIVVNKKMNIAKEKMKEIRLLLYLCKKFSIISTAKRYFEKNNKSYFGDIEIENKFAQILFGKINYFVNVKGEMDSIGIRFREQYNEIFNVKYKFNMDSLNTKRNNILKNIVIIEAENVTGTGFLLKNIGLITAFHVVYDRSTNIRQNIVILYKSERIIISESDVLYKNASFDYVIIKNTKFNSNIDGFDYKTNFQLGDKVIYAGYPDYCDGDDVYIADAKVTSLKKKTVVGYVTLVDNDIFHGMSGGPVLNESIEVIGYILVGNEMNEFFKNNSNRYISGFRNIECIIKNFYSVN